MVARAAACVDVVGIVVLALVSGVGGVGHSRPLCPVACPFEVARQAAHLSATFDVSHASAEAYGIGAHHTRHVALVTEGHEAIVVLSAVELEGAQIDPCAASHLLVHAELRGTSLVEHRVAGVVHGTGHRLVADIDGVASRLGDVGYPGGQGAALLLAACRGCIACGACAEGVLTVGIPGLLVGKSAEGAGLPRAAAAALFVVDATGCGAVVVHNHLVPLSVPFAGGEDNGAGLLQHGDDVGGDE